MIKNILFWINFFLVIGAVLAVLNSPKSPSSAIAWILAIVGIPGLGLLAYVLIGIDWKKRKLVRLIPEEVFANNLSDTLARQQPLIDAMLHSQNIYARRIARNIHLLHLAAAAPVTSGNDVQNFFSGEEKFRSLLKDLQGAESSIHMEYYIWRSDALGEQILEVLQEKAAEGVKIRLIFDGWGSVGKISQSYKHRLSRTGIEFSFFLNPANILTRLKINYRNHRKIAVIDGRIAYTGGMNIGQEYIDGGSRFEQWRDTHLRIHGPAASMLQAVFLVDWHNSGRELLLDNIHFPDFSSQPVTEGVPVQIAISGPDSQWEGIRLHYLELLNGAREEILIQTPYFIPGEAMEQAMVAAALRGVRVVLLTVGIPDKRIPYWAGETYLGPLLKAGVEVYRYRKGFLHSKVLVQDRIIASTGTCNFDIRSFFLDYEVNAVLYSTEMAEIHAAAIINDLKDSRRITYEDIDRQTAFQKTRNATLRLLSPLM